MVPLWVGSLGVTTFHLNARQMSLWASRKMVQHHSLSKVRLIPSSFRWILLMLELIRLGDLDKLCPLYTLPAVHRHTGRNAV